MLDRLKSRVQELTKIAEHSVQTHNSLMGSLQEVKYWVNLLEEEAAKVVDEVKDVVAELV